MAYLELTGDLNPHKQTFAALTKMFYEAFADAASAIVKGSAAGCIAKPNGALARAEYRVRTPDTEKRAAAQEFKDILAKFFNGDHSYLMSAEADIDIARLENVAIILHGTYIVDAEIDCPSDPLGHRLEVGSKLIRIETLLQAVQNFEIGLQRYRYQANPPDLEATIGPQFKPLGL